MASPRAPRTATGRPRAEGTRTLSERRPPLISFFLAAYQSESTVPTPTYQVQIQPRAYLPTPTHPVPELGIAAHVAALASAQSVARAELRGCAPKTVSSALGRASRWLNRSTRSVCKPIEERFQLFTCIDRGVWRSAHDSIAQRRLKGAARHLPTAEGFGDRGSRAVVGVAAVPDQPLARHQRAPHRRPLPERAHR